ncbi:protein-tyrosine phosphatase family protein [Erwinia tasmaniensis]|uniref:protein-tyrosine phosphatase family protein n=1 Tax=Erwinia tasmaniensis TaxID=338565 RepID=UPI003A4DEF3C
MIKVNTPMLYIKAHLFKSTLSAVRLAEENKSPENVCFAKRLLEVKNRPDNLKLNKSVSYNNMVMKCSAKYADLLSRANACFPALPRKDYVTDNDVVTQYDKINKLAQSFQYINVPNIQRYEDIGTAACSQIRTSNGTAMPANKIAINGREIAMRCQYPQANYMAEHCRMLLEQKPAVVVVLSSSEDIAAKKLPMYFCEDKNYDGIQVTTRTRVKSKTRMKKNTRLGDLILNHHQMTIDDGQKAKTLSVIHVTNWPDRTTINVNELNKLTHYVKSKISEKCAENSHLSAKPLIHCNAGVGRTGTLIGAMALADNTNQRSVEDIVLDMRKTGSDKMVQTLGQYQTLCDFNEMLRTPKRAET